MRLEEVKLLECWYHGEFYTEEFLDIPGYEGLFKVSSFGRVWSCEREYDTTMRNGELRHGLTKGDLLNVLKMKSGYCRVQLSANGIKLKKVVHILVCMAFHPNPGNKLFVNHKDGNKWNNFFLNVEWATPMENSLHSFRGRTKTGIPGIYFHPTRMRFQGAILSNGKRHGIGDHQTIESAITAYRKKMAELGITGINYAPSLP